MGARQVYNIRFFINKEAMAFRHNIAELCWVLSFSKDLIVVSAVFDAIKLLILHGEAKLYCFTVSCVTESMSFQLKLIVSQ